MQLLKDPAREKGQCSKKVLTNTQYEIVQLQRMKKMWTENATFKRSCERKRAMFEKIFNEHHIVAI
jgi:hypothetical protein